MSSWGSLGVPGRQLCSSLPAAVGAGVCDSGGRATRNQPCTVTDSPPNHLPTRGPSAGMPGPGAMRTWGTCRCTRALPCTTLTAALFAACPSRQELCLEALGQGAQRLGSHVLLHYRHWTRSHCSHIRRNGGRHLYQAAPVSAQPALWPVPHQLHAMPHASSNAQHGGWIPRWHLAQSTLVAPQIMHR